MNACWSLLSDRPPWWAIACSVRAFLGTGLSVQIIDYHLGPAGIPKLARKVAQGCQGA